MGNTSDLYRRAKKIIPGGTQLLSKRPELMAPELWPAYYSKASGCEVWDLDGNRFIDMSYNGIGACILGAADPDVNAAVIRAVHSGSMSTLNCPEEVELAELLCELHPWAEMVRFARTGGEAMSIAVRIARAATGRDIIAFCGYHGWHDWYLAANLAEDSALDGHLLPGLEPCGVPRGLRGTALPFRYNRIEELSAIASTEGDRIAAVVMEPIRGEWPREGFLKDVHKIVDRLDAVLVFDEITAGFRLNTGGSHLVLGVDPDIAVFGKAMGNGYPIGAVIGKKTVMDAAQRTFISSTCWTEKIGPSAALATIRKHGNLDAAEHLDRIGRRVQKGWRKAAESAGVPLSVSGIPPLGHFTIGSERALAGRTFFTQQMLSRGYLATDAFYATLAHTEAVVDEYLDNTRGVFTELADVLSDDDRMQNALTGPVAQVGFQRLT